jgi:hypothetical protein
MFRCRPIRAATLALALAAPLAMATAAPGVATATTTSTMAPSAPAPPTEVLGETLNRDGGAGVVADASSPGTSGRTIFLVAVLALALVAATARLREVRRRRSYYF